MMESGGAGQEIFVAAVPDGPNEGREKPAMLAVPSYQGEMCLFICT